MTLSRASVDQDADHSRRHAASTNRARRWSRAAPCVAAVVGAFGLVVAACGSNDKSTFPNGKADSGPGMFGGGDAALGTDAYLDPDAFWAQDPPPMWCGPETGQGPPPPPGGTVNCPSDKNREGCGCSMAGQMAPCWPGLRAQRGIGQCKDGTTTCIAQGELNLAWGPCVGDVLPSPGATMGPAACKCFSTGRWAIANTSPCFANYGGTAEYGVSTYLMGTTVTCPAIGSMPPPVPPTQAWSSDTLDTDCAGHFKLCYTLKAGMASAPKPSDCTMASVCTEADYLVANQTQPFPDLPAWSGATLDPSGTCATQFNATGGYGEMSVIGDSVHCDVVDNGMGQPLVFNRVQYCPSACNGPNPPAAMCMNCMAGASGTF